MPTSRGSTETSRYHRDSDVDHASESSLAARAIEGDRDALADLYGAFAGSAFAAAHRLLGDRSDAEDVIQELFLALPQTLPGWDVARGRLGPWLRRVAVRLALMRLRAGRRRREVDAGTVMLALARDEEPHLRITIADALARLSEEQRVVFLLKEVEGYAHAEIAALLEISVRNSEVRLFRARQALRAFLGSSR